MKIGSLNTGFTIVELLIATAVFSTVIVGSSIVVLQITRMYYKGVLMTRTQNTSRNIVETVSRPIQLTSQSISAEYTQPIDGVLDEIGQPAELKYRCVGNQRFSWVTNMEVTRPPGNNAYIENGKIRNVLWREVINDPDKCNSNPPDLSQVRPSSAMDAESLVGEKMRLSTFVISDGVGSGLYTVAINIIYGDNDLIDFTNGSCKSAIAGSQWCAASTMYTIVHQRVNKIRL